jgi:hypothetical protein
MTAPRFLPIPGSPPLRLLITLAAVVLIALRKSDSLVNPQFWAEDGALFFIEVEHYGGWGLLFHSYQGYLLLIPRLIAALGAPFPLTAVPAFYAWSALAVTGAVAWWLQSPRLTLRGGAFAALAVAAVPHTGEVYLNVCNLQWITAIGLFALALTTDAATVTTRAGELVLLIFTGLTGPFIALALPLFAWRAYHRRSPWSRVLAVVALACATAHLPSLLARPAATTAVHWAPLQHAAVIGRRVVGTLFFGQISLPAFFFASLALTTFGAVGFTLWRRREPLPGGLLLLAASLLVLAATGYRVRPDTWTLSELVNGDRYFFISKIILLWLIAALAITSAPRLRLGLFTLLLPPLAANLPRFIFPPAPDQHWAASCALIARGEPVWVPILPPDTHILHPGRPRSSP